MNRLALLFPGQGSQHVGMGRELAAAHRSARDVFEQADEALSFHLSRLCFDGPEDELTATQNAQPAILTHSYAVWRLIADELTGNPVVTAGHSLGEFTAHLAAGTFDFPAALRLVRTRGELMARSGDERPGTMAVILGLDDDLLGDVCRSVPASAGEVVVANRNAPGQTVISGDVDAVRAAQSLATEAGARRVIPLNVSGAFHSPLMSVAAGSLATVVEEAGARDPGFPVIANATAEPVESAGAAGDTLVQQLTSPVRWIECVERMKGFEPDRWLELGPGAVLSGLLRRIDRSLSCTSLATPGEIDEWLAGAELHQ